jgi:hypothetical protein
LSVPWPLLAPRWALKILMWMGLSSGCCWRCCSCCWASAGVAVLRPPLRIPPSPPLRKWQYATAMHCATVKQRAMLATKPAALGSIANEPPRKSDEALRLLLSAPSTAKSTDEAVGVGDCVIGAGVLPTAAAALDEGSGKRADAGGVPEEAGLPLTVAERVSLGAFVAVVLAEGDEESDRDCVAAVVLVADIEAVGLGSSDGDPDVEAEGVVVCDAEIVVVDETELDGVAVPVVETLWAVEVVGVAVGICDSVVERVAVAVREAVAASVGVGEGEALTLGETLWVGLAGAKRRKISGADSARAKTRTSS